MKKNIINIFLFICCFCTVANANEENSIIIDERQIQQNDNISIFKKDKKTDKKIEQKELNPIKINKEAIEKEMLLKYTTRRF